MARLTHLQVLNKVLLKLRVSEVTSSTSNSYSKLVSELVNEARKEVEMILGLRWHDLRQEFEITTVASQARYSLTSFGEDYRIESVYNASRQNARLYRVGPSEWKRITANDLSSTPMYYRIYLYDANGDPQIELYPTPSAVETIGVDAYVGQGNITIDATPLIVPADPVIWGAYLRATEERGEDGGDPRAEARYYDAMTDALALEASVSGEQYTTDFYVA